MRFVSLKRDYPSIAKNNLWVNPDHIEAVEDLGGPHCAIFISGSEIRVNHSFDELMEILEIV
jgi:uncharacterized protein YlzI (FlbEa/FlbD family)